MSNSLTTRDFQQLENKSEDKGVVQRLRDYFFKERPRFDKSPYWGNTWEYVTPRLSIRDTPIDYRLEVGNLDTSSLVMAVVNWTGTQFTEAPPVVQKPTGPDGNHETEPGHIAAELVARPNPHSIFEDYCGVISLDWWIAGNHYWFKARNEVGAVEELWYLPSHMVEPRWPGDGASPEVPRGGDTFLSHYQYTVPGFDPVLYPASEIVHIKRFVDPMNRRKGIGAFGSVLREIYGDNAVATFTATLLRNMGMVPYLLSPKEPGMSITETEANAIKDNWLAKTTGANAGRPVVNAIPLQVDQLGLSPEQLDLSKLRMVPESRIASVTGIPAAMLQFMVGLENGTSYAAYREARQQGYESVVIPIQRVIASQLTRQLLPEFDKDKGAKFVFDTSQVRVLQEDRDALYKRAVLALQAGGISRNMFAASLGKPKPDKEEIYYVPSTVTPMTQELIEETAAEKPEPVAASLPEVDPEQIAKYADMDAYLSSLERQMAQFKNANTDGKD